MRVPLLLCRPSGVQRRGALVACREERCSSGGMPGGMSASPFHGFLLGSVRDLSHPAPSMRRETISPSNSFAHGSQRRACMRVLWVRLPLSPRIRSESVRSWAVHLSGSPSSRPQLAHLVNVTLGPPAPAIGLALRSYRGPLANVPSCLTRFLPLNDC